MNFTKVLAKDFNHKPECYKRSERIWQACEALTILAPKNILIADLLKVEFNILKGPPSSPFVCDVNRAADFRFIFYTCAPLTFLQQRTLRMSEFRVYFDMGKEHILDYKNGYDHILFVIALCALYLMRDWKRVLVLVTAFTIGHSVTLALSALNIISVRADLIEFLIPLTIFITAVSNIFKNEETISDRPLQFNYVFAAGFGLIHGLGFSNYLKSILGKDERIISQLLAFNLGLEVGQIIIVVIFLTASFILVDLCNVNRRDWKIIISSAIAGIALMLMKEKIFWN
jgi:hypothetical protein